MCGVAAILFGDAAPMPAMLRRLAHRGPDGSGTVTLPDATLGHTRLAMVDASNGAQPIASAGGRYTLVYNGELFNDAELRASLAGYAWRSRCDAETILAAWERWGEACVDRLDGMFAFVVWDATSQTAFAVRDRLGVKPLAYARLPDGTVAFASEAQALAPVMGGMRANVDAIVEYLVAPMFSGVARSMFSGIDYVQPGSILRATRAGIAQRRYWRWAPSPEPVDPAELRHEIERAMRGALRSDAPLGIFLSGGLDSTAIAALAPPALPAFTIVYDHRASWDSRIVVSDDAPFARLAAGGRPHHEVRCDRGALATELAAIARVNDALPAWEQELSQRALARAASAHVKGVLVGDAADELHYGYHFVLDEPDLGALLRRFGTVPIRRHIDPDPVARLVAEYGSDLTRAVVERWLPRLLHNGDIHTMAFGVEARVPFAATAIIELASRIDPARARDKAVLREALRGLVPEAIRTRRKSALPKDQDAFATYRDECARVIADPHPIVRAIVDLDAIEPARMTNEADRAKLFRVISLHHWAIAHEVST